MNLIQLNITTHKNYSIGFVQYKLQIDVTIHIDLSFDKT